MKFLLLFVGIFFYFQNVSSQCLLECTGDSIAVQQMQNHKTFRFLSGGSSSDLLTEIAPFELKSYKKGDTVIWNWNPKNHQLNIVNYNAQKHKKKLVRYTTLLFTENKIIQLKTGAIKISADYYFSSFGLNSVKFSSNKKGLISLYLNESQKLISKNIIPSDATANSNINQLHVKSECGNSIANPFGPAANKKRNEREAFSRDSALSYQLAVLKKAMITQQTTVVWQNTTYKLAGWSDSLFADVSGSSRELHQVEIYMEERNYNDLPMRGFVSDIYPDLFAGKGVQVTPHYKRNDIRGFRFLWYTYPMLQFGYKPGLKDGTPVLMVIHSSDDSKVVTNALYPESLFLQDSIFQEIYSNPNPRQKAESILGWNAILGEKPCSDALMRSAIIEEVTSRGYTLDAEIKTGSGDETKGPIKATGKNLLVVGLNCRHSVVSVRMNEGLDWVVLPMNKMFDYRTNAAFVITTSFKKDIDSYLYLIDHRFSCKESSFLFFSATSE